MKFLAKSATSPAARSGLVYSIAGHNERLRALLLEEQRGFCAYTEKVVTPLDTCAVEHFDRAKKGTASDGYYNYYAVLQSANQRKRGKETQYRGAAFFGSLFFQAPGGFTRRIRFVPDDFAYEEIDAGDEEARSLIDYLGLNDHPLVEARRSHLAVLGDLFDGMDERERLAFLATNRLQLSYPTALEAVLNLRLERILDPDARAGSSSGTRATDGSSTVT
ncbi:MAG: hypothetical protein HZA54_10185 [Planctomycetes bacterium]|nr:hypothetical protein [Planctomycetota bacterium]